MAMCLESKALLAIRSVDHECLAVFHILDDLAPKMITNPCWDMAYVDASTDFKQPTSEMPPQLGGATREHDDYHGTSVSSPAKLVPPTTFPPRSSHSSMTSA